MAVRLAERATKGGQIQLSDKTTRKGKTMGRIIKALVVLVIFAFIGLTGFAYLGDLTPSQGEVKKPVVLNAD